MIFQYKAACISRSGVVRKMNEDNFLFDRKSLPVENSGLKTALYSDGDTRQPQVFALFDGMGGELGGEIAAYSAAESLREQSIKLEFEAIPARAFLTKAITEMNRVVFQKGCEVGFNRMGTTAALIYLSLDKLYICNIGDSRIYRYANKILSKLTDDDVAFESGLKNQRLTQFLGINTQQYSLRPHVKKGHIVKNDLIVMCTDGLYNAITEDEIKTVIEKYKDDLPLCVEKLAVAAEEQSGEDNCTVLVIKFGRVPWIARLFGK